MKKFLKICVIAGAILLLSGLGISSLAAVAGGTARKVKSRVLHSVEEAVGWHDGSWYGYWDDGWDGEYNDDWDDDGFTDPPIQADENGYQTFSSIRNLDVEMDRGSVRIIRGGQTEGLYVSVEDPTGLARCYAEEDTLKIKWESKRRFKDDAKVQIVVPQDYTFGKIEMNMGAAYCVVEDISTEKLEMEAGVGSIRYSGQVAGDVEVEAGVGSVQLDLKGLETDYNYKIECGVGSIKVGGSSYSSLGVERRVDNQADHSMDLECGVGSIEIKFSET